MQNTRLYFRKCQPCQTRQHCEHRGAIAGNGWVAYRDQYGVMHKVETKRKS